MTESASASTESKKRGVGFPQMSLQESVDAVVTAGQNGPSHSNDAFSTYLGHTTANSGAYRAKLASLRDWGLIERGDKDRVKLSDLAEDLVLAAPDHYQNKNLLRTIFKSCRVFEVMYSDNAVNTPLEMSRLRSIALIRHGIVADQADRFVDSFAKSVVFAGLGESDGSTLTLRPVSDTSNGEPISLDAGSSTPRSADVVRPASPSLTIAPPPAIAVVPLAFRQSWDIDGGEIEIVIRTPKPLPPDIYALMAEMARTARAMAELLTEARDRVTMHPAEEEDQD